VTSANAEKLDEITFMLKVSGLSAELRKSDP